MTLYSASLPAAADLYGDIEPAPRVQWSDYLPGLLVAALAALASLAIVGVPVASEALVSARLASGAAFRALAGGAVASCGASSAMALATVLGERRVNQAQLTLVLVGISAMSALAMTVYPILC